MVEFINEATRKTKNREKRNQKFCKSLTEELQKREDQKAKIA
jgi:hypothetical protein